MTSMLQGTTPTLTFDFSDSGLTVSSLTAAELTISSKTYKVTHDISEMTVDSANNKLSYQFTEAETLQLDPNCNAYYQLYVEVSGEIYGTKKTACIISQKIKGEAMA